MFLKFSKGFFFFFFLSLSHFWTLIYFRTFMWLSSLPFPSSPSWNVILSMKYDGELKCPWWSIAGLDFHSHQWQKLTNSDIGVPEHVYPCGLCFLAYLKCGSLTPPLTKHNPTPRGNFTRVSRRSLKTQPQGHLKMKISCLHVCVCVRARARMCVCVCVCSYSHAR